jgi:GDPmannose 4,6-dehydratase
MWLSMQQDTSDNYIFCTGIVHSIKDLLNNAFNVIGINDWSKYVLIDNNFNRINEEKNITGDLKKTNKSLNWLHETNFEDMIKKMVLNDIKINEKSIICK